jgi:hypothetical protein
MRTKLSIAAVVFFALSFAIGQNDNTEINNLVHSLQETVNHGKSPSSFLSPNCADPNSQLSQFSQPYKTFSIAFDIHQLAFRGENHASLPATIEWSREESNLTRHTTLELERLNGRWYFTDFSFVRFPYFLFISIAVSGFVLSMLILVIYLRSRKKMQPEPQPVQGGPR